MIYLLDNLDFEIFERTSKYRLFYMWETCEERVKSWIENERTRSIMGKQEIVNQFNIKQKIQVAPVGKIKLNRYDKIIVWTEKRRYFVMELSEIKKI